MRRFTPAARVWIVTFALAALAVSVRRPPRLDGPVADWLGLSLLALCAAVAHRFPIKAATSASSYRLTNIFLIAGAIVLPAGLLTPLAILALTPDCWWSKRGKGILVRWLVNVPPTILAVHAAGVWIGWTGVRDIASPGDLSVLLGAATLFILTQQSIMAVAMALHFRTPIWRADPLSPLALLNETLFGLMGTVVGGLWLSGPMLLVLVLPMLIVAHRLTRTAHLAQLAQVDAKTGLHNSRHFEQVLEEELGHSRRLGRPLTVLFADLDRFKEVNDRYGHAAGDQVLQGVARLLAASLRQSDTVARFGGEEFVALLPGTDTDEATYLAERVRSTIEGHSFLLDDGAVARCTISVGLATCPLDGTTMASLMEQADRAMYRAKVTRNATARAGALPPVPRLAAAAAAAADGAPAAATAASRRAPRLAPTLLWSANTAGLLALGWSLLAIGQTGNWLALLPFLALALVAEYLSVQVFESNREKITLSFTIAVTMAAVTVCPPAAPLVNFAAALLHVVQQRQWRKGLGKTLFNLTNPALAALAASSVYLLLRPAATNFAAWHLAAAAVACLVFYLVNYGLVSLMISVHTGRPVLRVLRESFWYGPTKVLLGLTGAFLGGVHAALGLIGALVFAAPLLVMRYTLAYSARRSRQAIATLQVAKAEVEGAHREKEQTLRQLIETVAAIIDARDRSVYGHSRNVAKYAVALGEELGLTPTERAFLHTAGLLHDLGKIAVPEALLHKPGKLTAEEFAVVKKHAAIGERIIAKVAALREVARMVGEHHERYGGGGYPRGRQGAAISIGGRILAVADTLDSILSDRPYSRGKSLSWALEELDRCAGSHFDPAVVTALHRLVATRGSAFFHGAAVDAESDLLLLEYAS